MQSEPKAAGKSPAPGRGPGLEFILELEPWHRVFFGNLADFFRASPRPHPLSSRPGTYWADALVHRPVAWNAIVKSAVLHAAAIALAVFLDNLWLNQPRILPEDLNRSRALEHYELTEYLPPVNTRTGEKPKPPVRREAQTADPEYAPQEIVTINPRHNSTRQTIVNPVAPQLLARDTPLPNIVAWAPEPVPGPSPVAPSHPLNRALPSFTPEVAPPAEVAAKRDLNALQFPSAQPQVAEPAPAPVSRNLSNVGAINMALTTPTVEAPRLPTPEQVVIGGGQRSTIASGGGGAPASPPPSVAGTGVPNSKAVGQLIALNVHPVAPGGPVKVPEGSRQGEFTAGPTGRPGATARPEIAAGSTDAPSGGNGGANAPSVFVAAPPHKVNADVAVSAPLPKPDIPRAWSKDQEPAAGATEAQVFGDKRIYSMVLNMPNLNSSGGSWILRFAELNPPPGSAGEGVSGPVALSKSDPAYPAALVRDRVEGSVVLYAVIHSDGHVGEVRVLEGLHETLDENARSAMRKWRFRPGTRNGVPVDVEAVIRIPFRAPKKTF